jgi:hypothetical protein
VAYRTRRAFRAQYDLLVAASTFDEAVARFDAPAAAVSPRRRRRLEREVEIRRATLARQLQEFRSDTMHRLAPSDLIAGVSQVVLAHPPVRVGAEPAMSLQTPTVIARATSVAMGRPAVYCCLAAWAITADELVTRGISGRPSLIAAELLALALSPGAIFHGSE